MGLGQDGGLRDEGQMRSVERPVLGEGDAPSHGLPEAGAGGVLLARSPFPDSRAARQIGLPSFPGTAPAIREITMPPKPWPAGTTLMLVPLTWMNASRQAFRGRPEGEIGQGEGTDVGFAGQGQAGGTLWTVEKAHGTRVFPEAVCPRRTEATPLHIPGRWGVARPVLSGSPRYRLSRRPERARTRSRTRHARACAGRRAAGRCHGSRRSGPPVRDRAAAPARGRGARGPPRSVA